MATKRKRIGTPKRAAAKAKPAVERLLGKTLPQLELPSTTGSPFMVPKDFKKKWTILYFYPRDNTPGCTKQACTYRDSARQFEKNDIQVFGVSADSLESHAKFQSKFALNFPLLSDPEKKLSQALGVWRDKTLYGRVYKGINRDSFLVDPKGVIRKVWRKVDPVKSVDETLKAALEERGSTR